MAGAVSTLAGAAVPEGAGHDPDPSYSDYLRRNGFGGDNPWEAWANSTVDDDGTVRSGWFLKYSNRPARVPT